MTLRVVCRVRLSISCAYYWLLRVFVSLSVCNLVLHVFGLISASFETCDSEWCESFRTFTLGSLYDKNLYFTVHTMLAVDILFDFRLCGTTTHMVYSMPRTHSHTNMTFSLPAFALSFFFKPVCMFAIAQYTGVITVDSQFELVMYRVLYIFTAFHVSCIFMPSRFTSLLSPTIRLKSQHLAMDYHASPPSCPTPLPPFRASRLALGRLAGFEITSNAM